MMRLGGMLVLVLALSACGGRAKLDDKGLAAEVTKTLGAKQPLVCTARHGRLAGVFNHSYNRVCGARPGQPAVYVSFDTEAGTWCAVSPRFANACPR